MVRPKKAAGAGQRRQFTLEFKQEAIRQVESGAHSLSEMARRLGIRREILAQWQQQLRARAAGVDPTTPPPAAPISLDEEVRRLRRRVAELEEEQSILGKAMAFFAKRHG